MRSDLDEPVGVIAVLPSCQMPRSRPTGGRESQPKAARERMQRSSEDTSMARVFHTSKCAPGAPFEYHRRGAMASVTRPQPVGADVHLSAPPGESAELWLASARQPVPHSQRLLPRERLRGLRSAFTGRPAWRASSRPELPRRPLVWKMPAADRIQQWLSGHVGVNDEITGVRLLA